MNPRRSRSRSPRGSGGESTRPLAEVAPSSSTSRWAGRRGDPGRDITAQLFLSPCTVEYHLQNVYWKLGVAPILPRTGSGLLPGRTRNCQGHSELPHALSGLGHEPGHRWPVRVPGPLGGLDRREDTELALRERHQALGSASTIANVRCSVFSPPGIQVARRDDCWSRRWRDIRRYERLTVVHCHRGRACITIIRACPADRDRAPAAGAALAAAEGSCGPGGVTLCVPVPGVLRGSGLRPGPGGGRSAAGRRWCGLRRRPGRRRRRAAG